jgi:hypothetical protein
VITEFILKLNVVSSNPHCNCLVLLLQSQSVPSVLCAGVNSGSGDEESSIGSSTFWAPAVSQTYSSHKGSTGSNDEAEKLKLREQNEELMRQLKEQRLMMEKMQRQQIVQGKNTLTMMRNVSQSMAGSGQAWQDTVQKEGSEMVTAAKVCPSCSMPSTVVLLCMFTDLFLAFCCSAQSNKKQGESIVEDEDSALCSLLYEC